MEEIERADFGAFDSDHGSDPEIGVVDRLVSRSGLFREFVESHGVIVFAVSGPWLLDVNCLTLFLHEIPEFGKVLLFFFAFKLY